MVVPATLHIGRPCMRCTPRPRPRAWGGGTPHRRAPGREWGGAHSCKGGGGQMRVCCAVPFRVCRAAPLCAALHNVWRAAAHCAAHYTPHELCSTRRAVPHRIVRALPHYVVLSSTPVPRARQQRVEGTLGLVPVQSTSAP